MIAPIAAGTAVTWLWQAVIWPSWLSLVAAPFVLTGYVLLGRKRREGWWFVIASQAGLLAIALVDRQYGLVVVVLLIWQGFQNWRRWGRAAEPDGDRRPDAASDPMAPASAAGRTTRSGGRDDRASDREPVTTQGGSES